MVQITLPSLIAESKWQYMGADTGTLNVETPEVNVGVAATAGRIKLKHRTTGENANLGFGGVGGGVGLSLVPSPVNFSFAMADMPGAGIVYRVGRAGSSLELSEIKGPMIMYDGGADWGVGGSGTLILSGGSSFLLSQAMSPAFSVVAMPAFIASCQSLMLLTGMNVSLLPVNVGANAFLGQIF